MNETGFAGGRPGGAPGRDWTQGSIIGNLLRLSWPMVVSNVLMMLGPTIDMIWVGKLGTASIAGVGVAGIAVQLIMGAMMGLTMGMRAMVARFIGAGDVRGANHVAQQALVISGGFAALAAVIGAFFAESVLGLFPLEADVIREGAAYLRIMFIGAAAMAFRVMAEGTMQASGDTITPMTMAVIYRVFHIGLAPFLIFGWWIFPEMGVSGAAMTNVISQTLGVTVGMWYLFTGRAVHFDTARKRVHLVESRMKLTMRGFRFDPNIIWRIVRIGTPAMVSGMQRTLSQFFLVYFMAAFGTIAMAAHTVVQPVEMVLFMPGMAFAMWAGVLVGGILAVCSAAVLLFADDIIRIFNREPELVEQGAVFMRIAVVGYLMMPLTAVFMSALSGAGDTVPPMIISVTIAWAVQLPLAYFLPKVTSLGVYGVRWAIAAGMAVSAVAFLAYFRTGRWKRKGVLWE